MVKKRLCLAILSLLLACICLSGTTLPVFAAPERVAISAAQAVRTTPMHKWRGGSGYHSRGWWWRFFHRGSNSQEINQFHQGNSGFNNPIYSVGHDIGDTGNSGHNRGRNQDNDSNGGNQLVTTNRLRGHRRVNQYYYGSSNYNNPVYHRGYNQANNGNSGLNDGLNQDDSSNGGNQIIN